LASSFDPFIRPVDCSDATAVTSDSQRAVLYGNAPKVDEGGPEKIGRSKQIRLK
jgi:hypothetical protein